MKSLKQKICLNILKLNESRAKPQCFKIEHNGTLKSIDPIQQISIPSRDIYIDVG